MKYVEIKKLPKEELDKKLYELKIELMKVGAQVAIGTTPKNTKQIREMKRAIARINTLHVQEFKKELDSMQSAKFVQKKRYTNL